MMNHSSIGEIFHIEPQGGGRSPGGIGPGTVPGQLLQKRHIQKVAALAQQESESLSANVRLGIQFRNQQGKVQVNHNRFLGYTKDENDKLVIEPEEAEIVKRIYSE